MKRLILASQSYRRKKILEQTGYQFDTEVSYFPEDLDQKSDPYELVKKLSLGKAQAVAKNHKNAVILSADTAIIKDGEIIGKPADVEDAERILKKLSGTVHTAMTAYSVIDCDSGRTVTEVVDAQVTFRELSDTEISQYIASGEPMDKAGAYGAQDKAALFIQRIEGDFYTIVGLPICAVAETLRTFGISAII